MRGVGVSKLSMSLAALEAKARRKKRRRKMRGDAHPLDENRSGGARKSRNKGNGFERLSAQLWSNYYGCKVKRAPRSGGWATVAGFGPKGDLVFRDRKAPYHVECKKQEGWNLADLLTGFRGLKGSGKNSIEQWWDQACRDCKGKKMPMLVFCKNKMPPLLMMYELDVTALEMQSGEKPSEWRRNIPYLVVSGKFKPGKSPRVVMLLSDFFKHIRPPPRSKRHKKWKRGVG